MNEIIEGVRKSANGYEVLENPPMPPDVWADGGTDVQVMDDGTVVYTATGSVAVPETDAVAHTERCTYRTEDGETIATRSISLLPSNGFDCVPMNRAYETASAFALAAACVEKNRPTPDAHAVEVLAERIRVLADMALNGTLPPLKYSTVNGEIKEVIA